MVNGTTYNGLTEPVWPVIVNPAHIICITPKILHLRDKLFFELTKESMRELIQMYEMGEL